jgi:spore germination protein KC
MILLIVTTMGCWDQMEMDKRAYILCLGIDDYDEKKCDTISIRDEDAPKYNFCFEIATLKVSKSGERSSQGDESFSVTVGAHSIVQSIDILETTVENPAIMSHLRAVIISEDVAKKGIIGMSDYLLRDPEVRRITYIFVSKGSAADILDFKPDISGTVGGFLSELTLNSVSSSLILSEDNLDAISHSLTNNLDFLIPKLQMTNNRLICKGAAIMNKKGKFIGWLDDEDMFEGARFLRGLYDKGNIMTHCSITQRDAIIRIKKSKTKIKINKDMSVLIDVNVIGNLATNLGGKVVMEKEYILQQNKETEKEIKRRVEKALNYFQDELKTDVFLLNPKFKHYKYDFWKENKENWSEVFSGLDIEVKVSARIENIGSITSSK